MERNPLNIAYSLFVSWTGTVGTVLFENINSVLAAACGLASLIASVYAVALSRERLRQLEQCGQCEHRRVKPRPRLDHLGVIFLAVLPLVALIGCAAMPTKTDRAWFKVVTNMVEQVEAVTNQTTGQVTLETNLVPQEELAPDPVMEATVRDAGGAIGAIFGFGGVSAALAGGLYHIILLFRNRRITKALIQGIETAREIIKTTPQGRQLDAQYVEWLQENQAQANAIDAIAKLVDQTANNEEARYVAACLTEELQKQPQPPQP